MVDSKSHSDARILDTSKPVRTRDGRSARIICTDRKGIHPILALAQKVGTEVESVFEYLPSGRYSDTPGHEQAHDLVNIPVETVRFQPVYRTYTKAAIFDLAYKTLEELETFSPSRIGHIVLKYEDDELKDISYVPR